MARDIQIHSVALQFIDGHGISAGAGLGNRVRSSKCGVCERPLHSTGPQYRNRVLCVFVIVLELFKGGEFDNQYVRLMDSSFNKSV